MYYHLISTSMFHVPGMLPWYQNMYRSERHKAVLMFSELAPTLPTLCVHDLLADRIKTTTEDDDLKFYWNKPLAEWDDYFGTRAKRLAEAVDVIEDVSAQLKDDHEGLDAGKCRAEERLFSRLRSNLAEHRIGIKLAPGDVASAVAREAMML